MSCRLSYSLQPAMIVWNSALGMKQVVKLSATRCCGVAAIWVSPVTFTSVAPCVFCQRVFLTVHVKSHPWFSNGWFEGMMHLDYILLQNKRNCISMDEMLNASFGARLWREKRPGFYRLECGDTLIEDCEHSGHFSSCFTD
jgi:hypothetical protein